MGGLKRASEIVLYFVIFPLGCLILVFFAMAVGVQALLIYVGALIAIWLLSAFGLPMLFGVISPDELVDRIRNARHSSTYFEGEPLLRTASDPVPALFDPD